MKDKAPLPLSSSPTWNATALQQLIFESSDEGNAVWRATGTDPQFKVIRSDGKKILGGWYLISANVNFHESFLQNPSIYPVYLGQISEQNRVSVQVSSAADWKTPSLLLIKHDADYLRLDPSDAPCIFSFADLDIHKIGKPEAAAFMLRRLWTRALGKRNKLTLMLKALPLFLTFRFTALGEWLWDTYTGTTFNAYTRWVQQYDTPDLQQKKCEARKATQLAWQPTFSIIVPVYNTDENWLVKCIESALAQTYENWELCIADDASSKSHVRKVLQKYVDLDKRIKTVFRETNGHISMASNSALELAKGDYVVLLDHDDELPSCALYEVAVALNENKSLKLIYSDEDKIDLEGRRFEPYFKPDWNYELFLSQNYVSHLGIYQRELVKSVGGFRKGFEGSQDYDLALRCIERLEPHEIGHIAKVLYHWRAIPGSTALGIQEKNYATLAALDALGDHLKRIDAKALVNSLQGIGGAYHVQYALQERPLVSIIIPTKDKVEVLERAMVSILEVSTYDNYEIIVIDNQSSEPATANYLEKISKHAAIRVMQYDKPFNYSAINNYAVSQASGSMLLFLNNDVEVITPGWIEEMLSIALQKGVAAVGTMLYFPDNTIQHAGIILGFNGVAVNAYAQEPRGYKGQIGRARLRQTMSAVTGACLMVRQSIFHQVGGMNEDLAVAFNDVDLCLRFVKAGYRNVWTPFAELFHHESLSRGNDDTPEKRRRFLGEVDYMREHWGQILENDSAYNPNLALSGNPFSLAFPPRISSKGAYRGLLRSAHE